MWAQAIHWRYLPLLLMRNTQRIFEFLIISLLITGCNKFEQNLHLGIQKAAKTTLEANEPANFDLNSITDFEWDSVLVVLGNESVPVFRDEINYKLGQPANDLKTNRHRFYFITPKKEVVIKEVNSERFRRPYVDFGCCIDDEGTTLFWLTNEENKFKIVPNMQTLSKGSIYLFPNCSTKFNPNNFGIFYQNEKNGR